MRLRIFTFVLLLVAFGGAARVWIWQLFPGTPFVVEEPIRVIEVLPRGNMLALAYRLRYCREETPSAEVHYALRDSGAVYEVPGASMEQLPNGCHIAIIKLAIPMPDPDTYRLEMVRRYEVNPIKTIEVRSVSAPFVVR